MENYFGASYRKFVNVGASLKETFCQKTTVGKIEFKNC